jgi:hypothetical protein
MADRKQDDLTTQPKAGQFRIRILVHNGRASKKDARRSSKEWRTGHLTARP